MSLHTNTPHLLLGYGQSTGDVCESNTYADISAAYSYLLNCLLVPANRIILYGRSLGSGPSVELASRTAVAGMILQSPIASVHRVRFSPPFTLPGDMYTNVDKIGKTNCSILFIHGTMDDIVPFEHSKAMFKLCNPSKAFGCWIPGAGHNNIESDFGWALNWHVKRFLKHLEPPATSPATPPSPQDASPTRLRFALPIGSSYALDRAERDSTPGPRGEEHRHKQTMASGTALLSTRSLGRSRGTQHT
eukprot:GHVS01071642.1.p1 GENE.GHVS01071642.1~~GHVS01071642.1.p1  ORF type:complete len:247 (+),score=24.33 GHVS01071642.1:268-1008(+)